MELDCWLETHAQGYDRLSPEERSAIKDFALLWSLFGSDVLGGSASANRIVAVVGDLAAQSRFTLALFAVPITYFFARYYDGRELTPYFADLRFRANDHADLVRQVLSEQVNDDASILAALLIIIYRLRNNLLHGHRWSYEIQGQLDNFQNANAALMAYITNFH